MNWFRECSVCNTRKEVSLFVTNKATKSGYLGVCKDCHNGARRLTRDYTKDQEYNKEYIKDKPILRMYWSAKSRSRLDNLIFTIEVSDITIPEYCPYLKWKITNVCGEGMIWTNPSLDRKDPSKGYTKGNIEVISNLANLMKNKATKEQLIQFAKSILERNNYEIKEILK